MSKLVSEYITLPKREFARRTGLGDPLVDKMLRDGRLKSVKFSDRKEMVIVQSYLDLLRAAAEREGRGVDLAELGMA